MVVHKFVEQNGLWFTHFGQTVNLLGNFYEIFIAGELAEFLVITCCKFARLVK